MIVQMQAGDLALGGVPLLVVLCYAAAFPSLLLRKAAFSTRARQPNRLSNLVGGQILGVGQQLTMAVAHYVLASAIYIRRN